MAAPSSTSIDPPVCSGQSSGTVIARARSARGNLVPHTRDCFAPLAMTNLEVFVKVAPFGIHAVDEIDLLATGTGLDLLLAGNGGVRVIRDDIVHESKSRSDWIRLSDVMPALVAGIHVF